MRGMKANLINLHARWIEIAGYILIVSCMHVHAGIGTSAQNETINTQFGMLNELVVTMHRATDDVLENATSGAGIDEPLRVKGSSWARLSQQPQLPLDPSTYVPYSGLVADGVTPLIFRISHPGTLAGDTSYSVKLKVSPSWADCPDLNKRFMILDDWMVCRPSSKFTLSPDRREVYFVLMPVDADEIGDNAGGVSKIVMTVEREKRSPFDSLYAAQIVFGVRKPPIVLVHGYNADTTTWGASFLQKLRQARGSDFVIRVGYGNANDNYDNTYGNLDDLVGVLDQALIKQVEDRDGASAWSDSGRWAWTRYDAVGHSQGGVLLRLLCSESGPSKLGADEWKFRNKKNYYRGRFRRVVTIGSPHFGSTIAHLAILMKGVGVEWGAWNDPLEWGRIKSKLDTLLRPKFLIDSGQPGKPTPYILNKEFDPDPLARIHLLGATINNGNTYAEKNDLPLIYSALHFHKDAMWGKTLAPLGSDGVVDLRSQLVGTMDGAHWTALASSSRIPVGDNTAHAGIGYSIDNLLLENIVWGTQNYEAHSGQVGNRVADLLNEPNDDNFGPFPTFEECTPINDEMDGVADYIEEIVKQLKLAQKKANDQRYISSGDAKANPSRSVADAPQAGILSYPSTVLNLTLQPMPGETPSGPAEWSVVVYGPDGISTQGLTLATSGEFLANLRIDVAADVIGEIVVSVNYPSVTGVTVYGMPGVVLSQPPGAMTGIALRPDHVTMLAGPTVPVVAWGTYSEGPQCLLFADDATISFSSDDPSIATVDDAGEITLVAPGTTTVHAVYGGSHTGAVPVHVLAPAPIITSPDMASALVGVPFAYRITASNSPVAYLAEELPSGLTADAATGEITGAPVEEGRFHFTVGAANADGEMGRLSVALTVTGSNQPPTGIGMDAISFPALQPAGALVGRLVAADPNPLDAHSFSLVGGAGDSNNTWFSISGDRLTTTAILDPAVTPACSIRIRATDGGGLFHEERFSLPVMGAPRILESPADQLVFAGDSFALQAKAQGREPLFYRWLEDGAVLPGETAPVLQWTAHAPGAHAYHVVVSNVLGEATSSVAVVTAKPLSFDAWASRYAQPGMARIEPGGDIDGDGIANWHDYVFGTEPGETAASMPQIQMTPSGLAYVYWRALNISPSNYNVVLSSDLDAWNPYVPPESDVTVTPADLNREKVGILPPKLEKGFLKLEVTP